MPWRLVLVRHCQPHVDPGTNPETWGLAAAGRSQARALAEALASNDVGAICCGDQPKMIETVEPLAKLTGLPIEQSAAFGESHSEGWFGTDDFNMIVTGFFANPRLPAAPGWEPARDAARRFLAELDELYSRHANSTISICSGGRVLTAVLDQLGLVPAGAAFDTWSQICMPDVAVIEANARGEANLLRPFGRDDLRLSW